MAYANLQAFELVESEDGGVASDITLGIRVSNYIRLITQGWASRTYGSITDLPCKTTLNDLISSSLNSGGLGIASLERTKVASLPAELACNATRSNILPATR